MCLLRLLFQRPGARVDKSCSKTTLRQRKQRIKYHLGSHTHFPAQKKHKWWPAKGSNSALKKKQKKKTKNVQFQLNFVVLQWLPLLWLIIQEGCWLLGTDEDLAVSGNILGGGGWSKWKTNASSAHSAIFPVKIKGTPDWPLHGKLEMGPAFVCCC